MLINENKMISKKDYQLAINQICNPLEKYFSKGSAQLKLGNTGTYYSEKISYMEAFARPLWGLIPFWAGGAKNDNLYNIYLEGIKNGMNKKSDEYWGDIFSVDQRMVEMAVLGFMLCIVPDEFWGKLSDEEKNNYANWLYTINNHDIPDMNWLFFRILVNIGLKNVGADFDNKKLQKDLNRIDDFYLSEGWYSDGIGEQRDYYIPFGMHYYGLMYSKLAKDFDSGRCEKYIERAKKFARDFIYWFSKDGSAIPFGRSLTYKFAQSSFWGALAFADVEVFSWGIIKGLLSRNLRWWFDKPIFSNDEILTIGYTYPNLNMAEGYNGSGSSYWALKGFLPLALDDDHPFWRAREEELPDLKEKSVQVHPHMIIQHGKDTNHVVSLTSGQFAHFKPVHFPAKYEKFAYSNIFGFSVPRSDYKIESGAYDSMIAFREKDGIFHVRESCIEYKVTVEYIYSLWKPFSDVKVKTWLIPYNKWHIRIHEIDSNRKLEVVEGGFAIKRNDDVTTDYEEKNKNSVLIKYPWGLSGIVDLENNREPFVVYAEPNTNIMNERTIIPSLKSNIKKGIYIYYTAVFGNENNANLQRMWDDKPKRENITKAD